MDVDWRLKVFCPAFLQKSGRGPGAEPWPRAAARGTLLCSQSAGGGKGGTLAGGPPFAGGSAARSPRDTAGPAVYEGKGRRGRRPLQGGWETDRVPHNIPRDHPTPGRGLEERGGAGKNRDGGTSGTPSPTGRVRRHNARSDPAPGGGRTQPIRGAGGDREGGTPTPSGRARGVGMRGKPNVSNEKQRPPPAACARRRGPQRRQKRRPLRGGVFVDMGVWKRKIKFMWAHCVIVPFLSIKN